MQVHILFTSYTQCFERNDKNECEDPPFPFFFFLLPHKKNNKHKLHARTSTSPYTSEHTSLPRQHAPTPTQAHTQLPGRIGETMREEAQYHTVKMLGNLEEMGCPKIGWRYIQKPSAQQMFLLLDPHKSISWNKNECYSWLHQVRKVIVRTERGKRRLGATWRAVRTRVTIQFQSSITRLCISHNKDIQCINLKNSGNPPGSYLAESALMCRKWYCIINSGIAEVAKTTEWRQTNWEVATNLISFICQGVRSTSSW